MKNWIQNCKPHINDMSKNQPSLKWQTENKWFQEKMGVSQLLNVNCTPNPLIVICIL